MRATFRLGQLLILLGAGAPVLFPQERAPAEDPGRNADVQAIYSWVISNTNSQEKLALIAPETFASEFPQEICLEIPPDHAADFREMRADFDRRKNTTRKVPASLSPSKPYVILDPDVAQEVISKSKSLSDSPLIRDRYPGVGHLLIFSDVYFNQKRTVALVQVDVWCGGLCGRSTWIALEKGSGPAWAMRPWTRRCFAIAGLLDQPPPARAMPKDRRDQNSSFNAN